MDQQTWQEWFEKLWAYREETLYRQFFGEMGAGIYPIPMQTFAALGRTDPDPRYLTHGVFACPPSAARPAWTYITSGMSNPWGDSPETANLEGPSGLGYELLLCTKESVPWAIGVLHWVMAVQLLIASGEMRGEMLELQDRIPLGGVLPGRGEGPGLSHLVTTAPPDLPAQFALPSGKVDLLLLVGITAREADFAHTQGASALLNLLKHHEVFPLTDPARVSLV